MYDHPPSAVQSLRCMRGSTGAIADLPATLPIVWIHVRSLLAVLPRARGHVSARVMRSDEAVVPVVEAFELLTSFYIDHCGPRVHLARSSVFSRRCSVINIYNINEDRRPRVRLHSRHSRIVSGDRAAHHSAFTWVTPRARHGAHAGLAGRGRGERLNPSPHRGNGGAGGIASSTSSCA